MDVSGPGRRLSLARCLLMVTTGCSTVADSFRDGAVLDTGIEPVPDDP